MVQQSCAPRIGEELGTKADKTPGRNPELQPHPAVAIVLHLLHPPPAYPHLLGHHTHKFLGEVDHEVLHWFMEGSVHLPCDGLGHGNRELISLSPHHLDEYGKLELPPSHNIEGIGLVKVHPNGNIIEELFFK